MNPTPFPRMNSTPEQTDTALATVMYLLGEEGRSDIRTLLLKMSDSKEARDCLVVMNDIERLMEWQQENGETIR